MTDGTQAVWDFWIIIRVRSLTLWADVLTADDAA